ncbi:MAG: hypothetical protein U1E07_08485 [Hydrocarboniphaga sp.]|jgi:hypothetical protein|nr:hypothetical protein [Hydrocarboniphaga sp.]
MTTKLDSELKREVLIGKQPYTVILNPTSLKLTPKGKRLGIELQWKYLVSGDAAPAAALQASVVASARRKSHEPSSKPQAKATKKYKASTRNPRR